MVFGLSERKSILISFACIFQGVGMGCTYISTVREFWGVLLYDAYFLLCAPAVLLSLLRIFALSVYEQCSMSLVSVLLSSATSLLMVELVSIFAFLSACVMGDENFLMHLIG